MVDRYLVGGVPRPGVVDGAGGRGDQGSRAVWGASRPIWGEDIGLYYIIIKYINNIIYFLYF